MAGEGALGHVDVLVVGAGISGISAAHHLKVSCPGRSFAIVEARVDIGGTWDLFRYPGVRSDSDMHTLGFEFKPWTSDKSIADGPSIMAYLRETVAEEGIEDLIRFRHRVERAEWSTETQRWTVAMSGPEGPVKMTCGYLYMCAGYYSYKAGHTPAFEGTERFTGRIVHPQQWPEDLDWADKRVVVIGSGATAMTIVPAMADSAAHVTMLQRSPTWVISRPDVDKTANLLRRLLPARLAYRITRRKNTFAQQLLYDMCMKKPDKVRTKLLDAVRSELGPGHDVDTHFTPRYDPWEQRMCLLPNADLLVALREGRASVVTDHVASFDETGIRLASGGHLDADVVITATGLELVTLGEADFFVDGEAVDFSETWSYKGFAYSGVPNLGSCFGYVNASWTLRADLVARYVCRLVNHMARTGTTSCTPRLRPGEESMTPRPWIDGFTPNYMTRVMDRFPRQGDRAPWINPQRLATDRRMFLDDPVDDGAMVFAGRADLARAV
jgi:cation diffusion facilitator CzcD-associated flavoprotein CzcO